MRRRPAVLVVRALELGDFLTGVPAYRALRAAYPGQATVLALWGDAELERGHYPEARARYELFALRAPGVSACTRLARLAVKTTLDLCHGVAPADEVIDLCLPTQLIERDSVATLRT